MPGPAIIKLFSSTFSPLSPSPPCLRGLPCAIPRGCGRREPIRGEGAGACVSCWWDAPPSVAEEQLASKKNFLGYLARTPEASEPFSLGDP